MILRWFMRQFSSVSADPAMLDHCPVNRAEGEPPAETKQKPPGEGLSHAEKLKLAATRKGKPFECAADGLPRKVRKEGIDITVGVQPVAIPEPPPNVAAINRKRAK